MSTSKSEKARFALITGAGVRLGKATAIRLAEEGYDIFVHYHSSRAPAEETAERIRSLGRKAYLIQADLSCANEIEKLVNETSEQTGHLEVLVNNAAIFYPTPTAEEWVEHWDHFHNVNLRSPMLVCVGLLSLLKAGHGSIVNIVDIWARFPLKRFLPYAVAKAGLEALTKGLALELAPDIRVNGVSPGAALPATGGEGSVDKMLTQVPLGRLGGAEAIADAVAYLCGAEYVTGQILAVDGGRTINL